MGSRSKLKQFAFQPSLAAKSGPRIYLSHIRQLQAVHIRYLQKIVYTQPKMVWTHSTCGNHLRYRPNWLWCISHCEVALGLTMRMKENRVQRKLLWQLCIMNWSAKSAHLVGTKWDSTPYSAHMSEISSTQLVLRLVNLPIKRANPRLYRSSSPTHRVYLVPCVGKRLCFRIRLTYASLHFPTYA